MKTVFLTGISGYIGGTIAVKLQEKGYKVIGLVRNQEKKERLKRKGFETVLGDLYDFSSYQQQVEIADSVIHTADSDNYEVAANFITVLSGTNKPFLYTSGSNILIDPAFPVENDIYFTEDIPLNFDSVNGHRLFINRMIARAALAKIQSCVIVPSMVYGKGLLLNKESKQLPTLLATAKKNNYAAYLNDGSHAWSNVHVEDLADLYLLALEKSHSGSLFYAENGIATFKEIAQTIQLKYNTGTAARSWSFERGYKEWGKMMTEVAFGSNCRMNADKARALLNWQPKKPDILTYIQTQSNE